jgi:hypothetical protein
MNRKRRTPVKPDGVKDKMRSFTDFLEQKICSSELERGSPN